MKKSALLTPLALAGSLAVCLPAFAAKGAAYSPPRQEMSRYHSGFYLGGAIGGNLYSANLEQSIFAEVAGFDGPVTLGDPNAELNSQVQHYGFTGQIQLGYAFVSDWFFGAIEISGNGSGGTDLDDSIGSGIVIQDFPGDAPADVLGVALSSETDVEMNAFEPVIDLKLGFKVIPNAVVYARVGAAFNEIELSNTLTLIQESIPSGGSPVLFSDTLEQSGSNNVVGLRLGIGGEYRFSENLALTLDYIHSNYYGDADLSGDQIIDNILPQPDTDPFTIIGFMSISEEVDFSRDTVMMGLNYYF